MRKLLLSLAYTLIIHLWLIQMQIVKYFVPQKTFQGNEKINDEETQDFLSNNLKSTTTFKKGKLT